MAKFGQIALPESIGILAFGAHPDDIEFAVGAIIAKETQGGGKAHFVVCSRGEAATSGTPAQRTREAKTAAKILGASLEFVRLDGDARLKPRTDHALKLAGIIRKTKPSILLAPTPAKNQHPDHAALGTLVQTAARLARYGGIRELKKNPPHAIGALLFYAITTDAEPPEIHPILFDISQPQILQTWTAAMQAHASQMKTRDYVELQLTRARLNGHRVGGLVTHAVPLFPNDPLVFHSLSPLQESARHF